MNKQQCCIKSPRNAYQNITTIPANSTELSLLSFSKEFVTGFLSGILNPKNLLFYLSLFTVALKPDISLQFKILLGIWMTAIVFLWDVTIIYFLSKSNVRKKFSKVAFYVDKITGLILGSIGFSIIKSVWTNQ